MYIPNNLDFSGLVAGIACGALWPGPARDLGLLGTVFLRLIKSIIVPLLFGTLACGIAGAGNVETMGRIGGKVSISRSSPRSPYLWVWAR